jgi:hypothetical protein
MNRKPRRSAIGLPQGAAHDPAGYKEALKVLGTSNVERDIRQVEAPE